MGQHTTIASDALTVEVADLGAEMQKITRADGAELLWHGDAAFWTGRAPLLFPIVGPPVDGHVSIKGTRYEMAQHGFARRSIFALQDTGPDWCRHRLADSEDTRAAYPFAFTLDVTHRLDGATLSVTVEVTNRDTMPMPFGFGFHPAFAWPLPGATGQHEIRLANGATPPVHRLHDNRVTKTPDPSPMTDGVLPLDHALFEESALIFREGTGDRLSYSAATGPTLDFHFENLPYLGIWTKPGAPFLCIEPWHGIAPDEGASDALTDRPGTITLAPGATERFSWSLTVRG
ncbi:aldose 1-epimerase family protein [Pelagovum pacificum]|uniref:Aldose 1-epimerase family protein n=1 Tax=Pelagovum pacificum TaxID=2588711 RepID=A0A5C5GD26_9RHOB|nr:aldose 1-epimerase family protein [Pelagovum pacificum]QQA44163.1 aldose 1-epimerase family protein [Pelagovum pacificum]TNY32712.1 aldose 1-epimerase family protein [Pelagovum pacificum]